MMTINAKNGDFDGSNVVHGGMDERGEKREVLSAEQLEDWINAEWVKWKIKESTTEMIYSMESGKKTGINLTHVLA